MASIALGVALAAGACTNGATGGTASGPTSRPSTPAQRPAVVSPSPVPSPTPCTVSLTAPPGVTATGTLVTLVSGLNQPDDLLYAKGQLLIAELGAGRIHVLAPGQPLTHMPVQMPLVEGMTYVDGTLYAAGQAQDLVARIVGSTVQIVRYLSPVPGQDGVDGISSQGGLLIVPDSPRGVVDWVDPATGAITRQVGGFVRPTGAWPEPDGSVLIADEYGNAAYRVAPDGSRTTLVQGLPIIDDIAEDPAGNIFVVTPTTSGGRLVQILPGGGTRDLADHLLAPQGLAVDQYGNLYLSEEAGGRVDVFIRGSQPPALACNRTA